MATAPVAPAPPSPVSAAPASLRLPDSAREQWAAAASSLIYPDYHDLNAWTAFRDASVALAEQYIPAEIKAAEKAARAAPGSWKGVASVSRSSATSPGAARR